MGKLYVYAMTNDSGFAPCVKDGLLSLVCCKGGKNGGMRTAIYKDFVETQQTSDDIWILGVCGKGLAANNKSLEYMPVYLARVTSVLEMTEYYSNSEYSERADYVYKVENGALSPLVNNPHAVVPSMIENDICGKYAILSTNFVYFGSECGKVGLEIKQKYPQIFTSSSEKAGIDKHYRGYMVDRDFTGNIAEDFRDYDWFPSDGGCKVLSERGLSNMWIYDGLEEAEDETCVSICGRVSKNKGQTKYCPKCGKENNLDACFCVSCGSAIQLEADKDVQNNNTCEVSKERDNNNTYQDFQIDNVRNYKKSFFKTKKFKIMIVGIAAIVVAIVILVSSLSASFSVGIGSANTDIYLTDAYGNTIDQKEFVISKSEFTDTFLSAYKDDWKGAIKHKDQIQFKTVEGSGNIDNVVAEYYLTGDESAGTEVHFFVNNSTGNVLRVDIWYNALDYDGGGRGASEERVKRAISKTLNGKFNWSAIELESENMRNGYALFDKGVMVSFEDLITQYHMIIMPASDEMYNAYVNGQVNI